MKNKAKKTIKLSMGSRSSEVVDCTECKTKLSIEQRHAFKGKGKNAKDIYFCDSCLENVNKLFEQETKGANISKAVLFGVIAALVGSIGWATFTIVTKYTLGYIAIGIGWLVGTAVVKGSGSKRGSKLQIIATALTLLSIVTAEVASFSYIVAGQFAELMERTVTLSDVFNTFINIFTAQNEFGNILREALTAQILSPIGLLIWGIGLYTAYRLPQARKLS